MYVINPNNTKGKIGKMRKCMLGISILLFAILFKMTSTGMDFFCLVVGLVGLIVTAIGAFMKSE